MSHINAEEARRKSEAAAGTGSHEALRDLTYSVIEDQAEAGAKSVALPRMSEHTEVSYQALFEELKKDGYTVEAGSAGMFTINW